MPGSTPRWDAGAAAEGWGEDREVDARGSDVDVVEVGVVVRHEFGGFRGGVGNEPRRPVDDVVLAQFAPARLGLFPGLQQEVLDLGHGVHGVHQRHAPQPGQLKPGHTGHPVVGMDDVVAPVGLALADPLDFGDHAVQQFRQLLLRQLPRRPGQDVVDAHAGVRMFDGGLAGVRGPGKDLHFHAVFGQGGGQAPDIHIHAAGITGTGLFHRRGVQGQEGHTLDGGHGSPLGLRERILPAPQRRPTGNCIR